MKLILTIDTEADNQWDHGRRLSVENIKYIPRFQNLCSRYNIKPTYLVTSEVCDDDFAREILSDYVLLEKAEVGSHLHSWTTPPFLDETGYRYNDINHAFATELPLDLLKDKLKFLTDQVEKSFGKRPLSFRSGRYGFDTNVARYLIENKYVVDSSITPYISWSEQKGVPKGNGGPDFINEFPFPYEIKISEGSLLEIPVTILPTKFPINQNFRLARSYFRYVDNNMIFRIIRRLLFQDQPIWLRPQPATTLNMFEELIKEAERIKLPYLVMIFHSSELMPGSSIYRKDEGSIEKLFELLEAFFNLLKNRRIGSLTLTEAAENAGNHAERKYVHQHSM